MKPKDLVGVKVRHKKTKDQYIVKSYKYHQDLDGNLQTQYVLVEDYQINPNTIYVYHSELEKYYDQCNDQAEVN